MINKSSKGTAVPKKHYSGRSHDHCEQCRQGRQQGQDSRHHHSWRSNDNCDWYQQVANNFATSDIIASYNNIVIKGDFKTVKNIKTTDISTVAVIITSVDQCNRVANYNTVEEINISTDITKLILIEAEEEINEQFENNREIIVQLMPTNWSLRLQLNISSSNKMD